MNKILDEYTVQSHFDGKAPSVKTTYDQLLKILRKFGLIIEEPKKTSIHLVNKTALAGIATRKDYLILTIKSDGKLTSPRIHKTEQVSTGRFHNEVKVSTPEEVDEELTGWLKDAYELSA
jgi:hypothetical protein